MKPYEASVFMFVWYVVRYPPPVPCANTVTGQRLELGSVELVSSPAHAVPWLRAAEALEAFAATLSAAVG